MNDQWSEHNNSIYLEIRKKQTITFKEVQDKIEKYGVESQALRNFLRRYVF